MESAKKQKLSLKAPDPVTGFQVTIVEMTEGKEAAGTHFIPLQPLHKKNEFGLSSNFWELLTSDPALRAQLEKLVEEKVTQRLKEREEQLQKEVSEKARQDGLEKGREQARLEAQEEIKRIDIFCSELLKQKERVLKEHEKIWGEAFSHLLRRFLVPNAAEKSELLRQWLSESVERFASTKKVRVYFSPKDLELLQQNSPMRLEERWEYMADANLKPGEIHCECDAGGIFFSPDNELNFLDDLVAQRHRSLEDTGK